MDPVGLNPKQPPVVLLINYQQTRIDGKDNGEVEIIQPLPDVIVNVQYDPNRNF